MNKQRCDTASPWVGGLDGSAVEALAIDLARQAGELLAGRFGTAVAVEYKDESRRDPVTEVDRECQRVISSAIKEAFPSHGFLGEEGGSEDDQVVPDVVWVVDPLDGTKNYTCGLPVYACSIGVLYRGEPVVGAVYLPWPGDGKGLVLHGSAGSGAYADGRRVSVVDEPKPEGTRLAAVPGSFLSLFRPGGGLGRDLGEYRVAGSTVYEVALTVMGRLQLAATTSPRIWDVAAGVVLVREAGGEALSASRSARLAGLLPDAVSWQPLGSFAPDEGPITYGHMRRWSKPTLFGGPGIVQYVAARLRARRSVRALPPRRRGRL